MAWSVHLDQALPEAGVICELPDTLNQYIPILGYMNEEYNSSWLSVTSEKRFLINKKFAKLQTQRKISWVKLR